MAFCLPSSRVPSLPPSKDLRGPLTGALVPSSHATSHSFVRLVPALSFGSASKMVKRHVPRGSRNAGPNQPRCEPSLSWWEMAGVRSHKFCWRATWSQYPNEFIPDHLAYFWQEFSQHAGLFPPLISSWSQARTRIPLFQYFLIQYVVIAYSET